MGEGFSPGEAMLLPAGLHPSGPFIPYVGPFPSTSAHFLSTLKRGGEGGEKEGFEAGGEAARLKPFSTPPSPRRTAAAGREEGGRGKPA